MSSRSRDIPRTTSGRIVVFPRRCEKSLFACIDGVIVVSSLRRCSGFRDFLCLTPTKSSLSGLYKVTKSALPAIEFEASPRESRNHNEGSRPLNHAEERVIQISLQHLRTSQPPPWIFSYARQTESPSKRFESCFVALTGRRTPEVSSRLFALGLDGAKASA